jgi:hypothetical protein
MHTNQNLQPTSAMFCGQNVTYISHVARVSHCINKNHTYLLEVLILCAIRCNTLKTL